MARDSPPVPPGVWWSRRAGWPRRGPNPPAAMSRGNKPWPSYPALVPAAVTAAWGGLGAQLLWRGAHVGLAGKLRPPRARGPTVMLPGASAPGSGRAKLAPLPSEGQLRRGLGIFQPSSFSFYKGRILLPFGRVVVPSGSIFVL